MFKNKILLFKINNLNYSKIIYIVSLNLQEGNSILRKNKIKIINQTPNNP